MTQSDAPVLLFPTHYLGNFVLGLPWICQVLHEHPRALVVLDSTFADLAATVLPADTNILLYPRARLARGEPFLSRLGHYWRFLRRLRRHRRATLMDLEGERFTGVLARLSGCRRRIGPQGKRAQRFYTEILDLDYRRHRFNAFGEVVAEFVSGRPSSHFHYRIDPATDSGLADKLGPAADGRPMIAIHPGASVSYKLWPQDYFVELVAMLEEAGFQVIWVGAGDMDAGIIDAVMAKLPQSQAHSLCNDLDFVELVALYRRCCGFIGSDSGPMHLAASTGIPVMALFGPSVEAIWAPLGENSHVLRGAKACGEQCDAWQCDFDYHCLSSLHPARVMEAVHRYCLQPAGDAIHTSEPADDKLHEDSAGNAGSNQEISRQ